MAFSKKDLSVLNYANGFTQFHYRTTDVNATIIAAGYANAAVDQLKVGDMIMADIDTGGTRASKIYRVATNTGSVVTLAAVV